MKGLGIMQLLRDNMSKEQQPIVAVRAEGSNDTTIYVYDVIDSYWGASAQGLISALEGANTAGTLNVHFNTPGGDVFEGRAMANILKQWKGAKVAHIDALCASAGTTVALACDEVVMYDGSFFMIHNAWTFAYGNKSDLTETAALLDKIDGEIAADYVKASGATLDQVKAWMDAETWFTAEEAVAAGLAARMGGESDEDDGAENRARSWNLTAYAKAPKALLELPKPRAVDMARAYENNVRRMRLLTRP